ncbi:MAG TPA: flagellin [Alphaproteobacteria bacterium]|nr:flagellin [Alphaproteobacteria bacterium]
MTRVTDLAQTALTQLQIQQTQSQISDLQSQLSSGHVAQTYDGLAPQAQPLINLQNDNTKITQYNSSISTALQQMSTAQTSISSLISLASNFETTLVNALNGTNASNMALNQTAQSNLQQVAGLLNVQFNGQYVFSGTATNTAPVNLSAPGFTPPGSTYPSTPNTAYYQGTSAQPTVQADDNVSVAYGVTAASPGFEELIRSLNLAATTVTTPGAIDTKRLQEALNVIKQAISDMTTTQSSLGVSQGVLNAVSSSHAQLLTQLQSNISDIQNVDVAQASTNLSALEITLQSSYAVTARLSQLSIVQYL